MTADEIVYYRQRAATERQRAQEATHPSAAEIHEKMAVIYERLVDLDRLPNPKLHLVDVMNPKGRACVAHVHPSTLS